MPYALVFRKCSTIQGISVQPGFISTAGIYFGLVTGCSTAATVGGSQATKASLHGCGCPTAAACCQVDYRLQRWMS